MNSRKRSFCMAAAAALVAVLSLLAIRPAGAATPVRIMPLGDSITGSPGCWRALLWNRLQSGGYTDIDFVGTQPPQGCSVSYDGDNEGHGGALVTAVADQNQLPGWLSATHPDIVLMHFGTNDVWSNRATGTILAAYGKLVDQMRASNPNMRVLVAQIIPMNPSTCPECAQRVVDLNNAIPGWASSKSTAQSPVTVVDQWTGFSTATDTSDGVHPNDSGNLKMSNRWYPALAAALNGTTPPTTVPPTSPTIQPTSASPTPPRTTTPPVSAGCTATYRTIGQWTGGMQAEVSVTNSGTTTTSGWSVVLDLNGSVFQQGWNASFTANSGTLTATNLSWNGTLAPNASTTFGFIAGADATSSPTVRACTAR